MPMDTTNSQTSSQTNPAAEPAAPLAAAPLQPSQEAVAQPVTATTSPVEGSAGELEGTTAQSRGVPTNQRPNIAQPDSQGSNVVNGIKLPPLPEIKPVGPSFFGYKPPKWAHDFEYVRAQKGKGAESDSKTWLLYMVDRLLKMHSR